MEAGVERQLPRRRRQRPEGDARELQVDQVAQAVRRAELRLRWEAHPQLLGRHLRIHGEDEARGARQIGVGEDRHAHAVAAVDQIELHRVALEHRREHAAQLGDDRKECGVQIVVPVEREFVRKPRFARESGQIAGQLQAGEIKLLRMAVRGLSVLAKDRLGAVEGLQHQEIGHLGNAVAQLAHAPGQGTGALLGQAMQQRGMRRQLLGRVDAGLRRDVIAVDDDLVVATALDDAGNAEQCIARTGILGPQQAQVQFAGLHRLRLVGGIGVIAQLLVDDAPAVQLLGIAVVEADLGHAFAVQRHGEIDELAFQVGRDVERYGLRVVLRNRKRRAVREDSARPAQPQPAEGQQPFVEGELEKAPGVRARGAQPHLEQVVDMACLLLKVMWKQEHALRPHDLALQAHGGPGPITGRSRLRPTALRRGS